jgi:hypothetical protein
MGEKGIALGDITHSLVTGSCNNSNLLHISPVPSRVKFTVSYYTRVYPKVSGLAAWLKKYK